MHFHSEICERSLSRRIDFFYENPDIVKDISEEYMEYAKTMSVAGSALCAEISMRLFKKESLFEVSKNHNPGVANAFIYGGVVCGSVAVAGDLLKGILPVFLYTKIFKECDFGLALVSPSVWLGIVMMSLIVCLRVRNDLTEEEKKKVCCLFVKFG